MHCLNALAQEIVHNVTALFRIVLSLKKTKNKQGEHHSNSF